MPEINYYPVCLDIKKKNCLVVGGGRVGARKALTLARCGARVTVVSPVFSDIFKVTENEKYDLILIESAYRPEYLEDKFIVIAATSESRVNTRIGTDARKKNILCNIIDCPDASDFIVPSIVHRGDLIITVSTSGTSPAFAKKLKKELEKQFGKEYADFLFLMGRIRKKLLADTHAPETHSPIFRDLIKNNLLAAIERGDMKETDNILGNILGPGYSYHDLISGEELL